MTGRPKTRAKRAAALAELEAYKAGTTTNSPLTNHDMRGNAAWVERAWEAFKKAPSASELTKAMDCSVQTAFRLIHEGAPTSAPFSRRMALLLEAHAKTAPKEEYDMVVEALRGLRAITKATVAVVEKTAQEVEEDLAEGAAGSRAVVLQQKAHPIAMKGYADALSKAAMTAQALDETKQSAAVNPLTVAAQAFAGLLGGLSEAYKKLPGSEPVDVTIEVPTAEAPQGQEGSLADSRASEEGPDPFEAP